MKFTIFPQYSLCSYALHDIVIRSNKCRAAEPTVVVCQYTRIVQRRRSCSMSQKSKHHALCFSFQTFDLYFAQMILSPIVPPKSVAIRKSKKKNTKQSSFRRYIYSHPGENVCRLFCAGSWKCRLNYKLDIDN